MAGFEDKELILHIGPAKTGTSAIQKALFDNAHLLSAVYCYPERDFMRRPHQHAHICGALGSPSPQRQRTVISRLAQEISESTAPRVVLSSEFFSILNRNNINKIYNFASSFKKIVIVYCVRNLFEIQISLFNQFLKTNKNRKLHAIIDIPNYINVHKKNINNYSNFFGNESISFMPYSDDLVVNFFERYLDCKPRVDDTPINPSIDFGLLMALAIPYRLTKSLTADDFKSFLARQNIAEAPAKPWVHNQMVDDVHAALKSEPGFAALLPEAMREEWRRVPEPCSVDVSESEIVEYIGSISRALDAFGQMLKEQK